MDGLGSGAIRPLRSEVRRLRRHRPRASPPRTTGIPPFEDLTGAVLSLQLELPATRPLAVLAIGAHPDDIEIGAGGTLLTLAEGHPGLRVRYVVLTGTEERHAEARHAAAAFIPGAD